MPTQNSMENQYFLMPYRFLQECWNSARFHWIPPELAWIQAFLQEWHWNSDFFSLYKVIF